ncbi:MAG: hypothetical protein IJT60_05695 [Clostridia bacterium]|nr:hypothetical protein [Clostridia bacterium]
MAVQTLEKLSEQQLKANGVQSLADRPNADLNFGKQNMTAESLKQWFDRFQNMLRAKVNEIIDLLGDEDAAKYIRVSLDTLGIETLQDLVDSFLDGTFARDVLKAKESVDASTYKTLQTILNGIAATLSTDDERLTDLENDSVALQNISLSMVSDNVFRLTFQNANGDTVNKVTYDLSLEVGTSRLTDGAVTAAKLGDQAVTSGKIYPKAVTQEKIADGAVGTGQIGGGAVTNEKLASAAVSTGNIVDEAVTEGKLHDGAVTEGKIYDGAVSTNKVADGNLTEVKMASGVKTKLNAALKGVTYNGTTGVWTFTDNAGNTITVDTDIERLVSSGYFDEDTEDIVLVLASGDEIPIPLDDMLSAIMNYIDNIHSSIYDLQEAPPLAALESAYLLTTPTLAQLADLAS